jgi:3-methyladenine DNA glycosylase AlkD
LPYEEFLNYLDTCVSLIDNWALCDSFKAKCIFSHKQEFLPILENIFSHGGVYYERYALVSFLYAYMESEYLPIMKTYILRADTSKYYVHMAVAWLIAEILVNDYEYGVGLLQEKALLAKTHNKAIQKAIESYRLTNEQKGALRSLKIK